jgi:aspartate kinase
MNDSSESSNEAGQRPWACAVMKFGGTSVADAAAIRRLCQLVARPSPRRPVVVVSALAKVTDQLMNAGWAAAAGQLDSAREILQVLRQRHETVARGLANGEERKRLSKEVAKEFKALDKLLAAVASEKALTARAQDSLLGAGESLSSRLVDSALRSAGVNAVLVDARECIVTDAAHTRATPLWDETNERLQAVVVPLLESGRVPVMGGFVGATRDGIPTTLGRGGSDFTAAIVGASLHAERIEIWTDVDGMMTTDPRITPEARRIKVISFDEAAELAYFGAKVLHPATVLPAVQQNIPVYVLNSMNPTCEGTKITARAPRCSNIFKAIALKKKITLVEIAAPRRLLVHGYLKSIFEAFDQHDVAVDVVSTSEVSVSVTAETNEAIPALAADLAKLADVKYEGRKAIVCLVGENLRDTPGIAAKVFGILEDVKIRMISQGASEINLTFVIEEDDAAEVVRRLHRAFFAEADPEVFA